MTNATTPTDASSNDEILTVADFCSAEFEAVIGVSKGADCRSLQEPLNEASQVAKAAGEETKAKCFSVLAELCGFSFQPRDRASPFGPMFRVGDKRSAIPEDFKGAQGAELSKLIPKISTSSLRARVADTVWLNNKRDRAAADAAIDAYCQCIKGLLSGELSVRFDRGIGFPAESLDLARRALQIARSISGRADLPTVIKEAASNCLSAARDSGHALSWKRAASLCFEYDLIDPAALAVEAEERAIALDAAQDDPHLVRSLWHLAADAHRELQQEEERNRCRIEGAEQLAKLGEKMGGMAGSSWTMDAIKELRRLKGTKDRRKELEARLREHQQDALDDMGTISHSSDLSDLAKQALQDVEDKPLGMILAWLADITRSRSIEALREEALQTLEDTPLSAMFSAEHVDDEGKVISRTPSASLGEEPSDEWFRHKIAQRESFYRQIVIKGQFEPFRRHINSRYSITEAHFLPVAYGSRFVPPGYELSFAQGFARMIQGDWISSTHLLVPLVENSVRYLLKALGEDTSIIQSDMVQEDRSLSAMLEDQREKIEGIFGKDLTSEIDLLFNDRAGPALRHEMAHGKLSANHCYGSDAVYACWLIYRITCIPLFSVWQEKIAPSIDGEC